MHCLKCYSTCANFQHLSIGTFITEKNTLLNKTQHNLHMGTTLARFKPLFELSGEDVNIVL